MIDIHTDPLCLTRLVIDTSLKMAARADARDLSWDTFSYDAPWPCKDGCCQYYLFNDEEASVDHDRIFTHVHDDNLVLDHQYASLKSEIMNTPNLTYKDFVFMIWTDPIVDQMIIGTNQYGFANDYDKYEEIQLNDLGRARIYITERA